MIDPDDLKRNEELTKEWHKAWNQNTISEDTVWSLYQLLNFQVNYILFYALEECDLYKEEEPFAITAANYIYKNQEDKWKPVPY